MVLSPGSSQTRETLLWVCDDTARFDGGSGKAACTGEVAALVSVSA